MELAEMLQETQKATRQEQAYKAREETRLKKEPFKTIVTEGLHEQTLNALKGFLPPNGAYILFEQKKYFIQPGGDKIEGYDLCTMWVEDRPEQIEAFRRNVREGRRPIHYAHFPKLNDQNPARAQKARTHAGISGVNPWDALEREFMATTTQNPNWKDEKAKLESEKQALEAKYQEAIKAQAKHGKQ